MTRAELFWLAYLWLCNERAIEQARQFRDAWARAFEGASGVGAYDRHMDRLSEAATRASPLMMKATTS